MLPSEVSVVGLATLCNTVATVASSSRPGGVAKLGVNVQKNPTIFRSVVITWIGNRCNTSSFPLFWYFTKSNRDIKQVTKSFLNENKCM